MKKLEKKYDLFWETASDDDIKKVMEFNDGYKKFMDNSKTERESVEEIVKIAKANGYRNLKDIIKNGGDIKSGDKVYAINMDKAIALFNIGEGSLVDGMNIIGSHVDAPRIDLKPNALYQDEGLALFETHYYGGIKKYQWVTIPLAIHGVFIKENGEKVNIVIGEDENDPVVYISDLLIHLSANQMEKKLAKGIEGEDLNILVGSIPLKDSNSKAKVKSNILKILHEKYDIVEEDFVSAEIEIVPAGKSRDVGLDRSMVMAYGHDDRVCAYTSLMALTEISGQQKTAVTLFVDKEEIGSVGATGMESRFFENMVAEIMNLKGEYTEINLRRSLSNSNMLSADVTAAMDPIYKSVLEKNNAAYLGKGVVLTKYTGSRGKSGSNDANAEFVAKVRRIFNNNKITWQTAELGKVDQGGGGTIAYILAQYGMEVVDCGVALLSMHAPFEIASKADVYEAYRAYKAFMIEA
ncbi:aminopeptidase [Clostridium cylindrosporum]|uniref:M18 family aminopeptidase n=1 Tax=Clostridium cylindrosporum DSM 605 TaxID=1121307 RepID=A0A0J8G639_CLOCY|nr:aminopeptidase [Clostridium cylindrosporum]KMT23091.1 putative M18 family aminopeptidase 1 [Clostridium cylindrosporum DSM 605]